jgi:hypothetical protein
VVSYPGRMPQWWMMMSSLAELGSGYLGLADSQCLAADSHQDLSSLLVIAESDLEGPFRLVLEGGGSRGRRRGIGGPFRIRVNLFLTKFLDNNRGDHSSCFEAVSRLFELLFRVLFESEFSKTVSTLIAFSKLFLNGMTALLFRVFSVDFHCVLQRSRGLLLDSYVRHVRERCGNFK